MKDINDYIDSFGMIVTSEKDGGDSCSHGCAILYASVAMRLPAVLEPIKYLGKLEKRSGRYCRHPDDTKWYSNIDTLSRDQLTPLLALMGLMRHKGRGRLFAQHLKRLCLFSWNIRANGAVVNTPAYAWKFPDVTFIDIHGMWIRAFRLYPLYPLLFICDIPTLIGSILYRTGLSKSTIQMNQVVMVDYSNRIMPTLTSLAAKWIYGKAEPINALNKEYGDMTLFNPPVNDFLNLLINLW